jgi:hypothetical protein
VRRLPFVFLFGLTLASACGSSSLGPVGGHSGSPGVGGAGGNARGSGGAGGDLQGLGGAQGGAGGTAVTGGGGRSDAGSAAGCQPSTSDDGVITWNENGAAQCGFVVAGNGTINSAQTFLSMSGTTATGKTISITVSNASGLAGVYSCKNDASINDLYVNLTYSGAALENCTITVDSGGASKGAPATGSFSATLTAADGGAIDLTNGTFDTLVFVPPP